MTVVLHPFFLCGSWGFFFFRAKRTRVQEPMGNQAMGVLLRMTVCSLCLIPSFFVVLWASGFSEQSALQSRNQWIILLHEHLIAILFVFGSPFFRGAGTSSPLPGELSSKKEKLFYSDLHFLFGVPSARAVAPHRGWQSISGHDKGSIYRSLVQVKQREHIQKYPKSNVQVKKPYAEKLNVKAWAMNIFLVRGQGDTLTGEEQSCVVFAEPLAWSRQLRLRPSVQCACTCTS